MVQGQSNCLGGGSFSSFTRDFWWSHLGGQARVRQLDDEEGVPETESLFGQFRSFKLKYAKTLLFFAKDLPYQNKRTFTIFPGGLEGEAALSGSAGRKVGRLLFTGSTLSPFFW